MKRFHRTALGVAALSVLAAAAGAAPARAATYKIHWLLGHKNLDYFEEAAATFKSVVEKGSDGDISVDISAKLGDEGPGAPSEGSEIASKVAKGEAEMGHSFTDVLAGVDPRLYAFEAPFLFRGYRHMEGVIEGPVGSELLDGLRAHGVAGLSFTFSGGASGIATVDREIRRPEDLKGLKVGVYGDPVDAAWLEELGATAVPIGHELESIAPLARERKLDAVVTTWRNFDRGDLGAEFRQVGLMGSTFLVSVTYINPKFFDALPEKYRALITKASRDAARIERAKTIELNAGARRGMVEDRGVREIYATAESRSRFVEALRPAYERAIAPAVGGDLIERIRNTPDAPEQPPVRLLVKR